MHIIKLDATDSTNTYLKKLSTNSDLADYTVVVAKSQTSGRGQMGAIWSSEASKNLTFSIYKDVSNCNLESPFFISMVVSLALLKTISSLSIPKLSIKWPNDILSDNKKICGILIENVYRQNKLASSIIGVGLNVNQLEFDDLPKASSLRMVSGRVFDLDEITIGIINDFKYYFNILKEDCLQELKNDFEALLFRKNKPSTFEDAEGLMFSGIIKGVSKYGNLQVLLEDNIIKEFDLKTITLLY